MVGFSGGARPFRIAASATRFYAGEPMMRTPTYSSGAISVNTITPLTTNKPTVATDEFVGIACKNALPATGTVVAHTASVSVPIPYVTKLRGRAKTITGYLDTDANLILILQDAVHFDLTAGAYTINPLASANTDGLNIVDGNIAKGTLDVVVDARAMRQAVS